MTELDPELARLGTALEDAAAADLRRRRPSRRVVAVAAGFALAIPAVALATVHFVGTHEVEASLPAGARILVGTDPTCTVVRQDVEYHCVLKRPPAPEVSDFTGTVYQTVDKTEHVNGGCRSLRRNGLVWQCYIGEEAVRQAIISEDFLGELQTGPAVG
jgi:hypothetical protein